jgi:SAM-dependent methyltransferase
MNFWDALFNETPIWGLEASDSAILTAEDFSSKGIKNVLIPGIGYGRNAIPFFKKGINISGIEISQSAINIARKNKFNFPIQWGSVLEMPFNSKMYDGIYCYSLLHLFNKKERNKFLNSCFKQLNINGEMIFVVISTNDKMFGYGEIISENYFKMPNGLSVFFYTPDSIKKEFKDFGLIDFHEINEPIKHLNDKQSLKCFIVKCKKTE